MSFQPRFVLPVLSILLAVGLVLAIVMGGSGGGSSSPAPNQNGSFDGAAYPLGIQAPDFALNNQQGRRVSLRALRGQVVMLAFLSTDCRGCVLAAQQIRGALDELASSPTYGNGTNVPAMQVLFVSTSPNADTPSSVKRFLAEADLSQRASYLTGTERQLGPIWHAYKVPSSAIGTRNSEAITLLLIGPSGAERDAFGLEQLTPESLTHDIRLLRDGRPTAG